MFKCKAKSFSKTPLTLVIVAFIAAITKDSLELLNALKAFADGVATKGF
jgi:hypothetical protein